MCLPKPPELVALYDESALMFSAIREAFAVPDRHTLDVSSVDRHRSEDDDLAVTAALALYYIQSLRVLAKPDVRVRVTSIVNTTACLHQVLQALAARCDGSESEQVHRARAQVGLAAKAVARAQVSDRNGARHMS